MAASLNANAAIGLDQIQLMINTHKIFLGFGIFIISCLLFQIILMVKKRNEILFNKNAEIAALNEKLKAKVKKGTIEINAKSTALNNYYENLPGVAYRFKCDAFFTPIFISKGYFELFEVQPEFIVNNKNIYQVLLTSDDYKKMMDSRRQFVEANDKDEILELIYRIEIEGRTKWIRDRCKLQIDKKGNRFLDGILLDISKEKAAVAALKNSQKQLSTIYNSSKDFIGLIKKIDSKEYIIESFNQPALDFLLQQKMINTPEELQGKKVEVLFKNVFGLPKELLEVRMEKLHELFTDHKTYRHSSPLSQKKSLSFETVISPILNEEGECTHALYSARNITESEMAKKRLVMSEQRLSSIFNGVQDQMAVFDVNDDGEIIFESTNQSFKDAWRMIYPNLDLASFYGKDIKYYFSHVHDFSAQKLSQRLEAFYKSTKDKKPFNYEEVFIAGNKEKYFLDINILPILNKENLCKKLLFILRNITEKHRAKEKMISKILEMEDRERSRFAKELHDGLGQNLTAASLSFNYIKKEIENNRFDIKSKLESGILFLNEAIEESRNIAHNLMPKSISDFGYALTVENLLENLSNTTEVDFSFYTNLDEERLPPDHELHLYRITQEAINNILKHAQATKVIVQLIRHENSVILTIEDNGKGFDWHQNKNSFGLNSMQNRASALSGVLDIDKTLERGTSITLEIPSSKRVINSSKL